MKQPDAARAVQELKEAATDQAVSLDVFLDSRDESVYADIGTIAESLVTTLTTQPLESTEAESAAVRAAFVCPVNDPAFWGTDLGRLISVRIGWARAVVPRAMAAAIIGYSRQRVHQLIQAGILVQAPDGGVTNDSLITYLRLRTTTG